MYIHDLKGGTKMKKIMLSLLLIILLSGCAKESNKPEMALEDFDQTVLALQMEEDLDLTDECARLFVSEQQDYCINLFEEYQDGEREPVENIIYTNISTKELSTEDKTDIDLANYDEVYEVTYEYTIADDSTTHTETTIMVYIDDIYYLYFLIDEE